MKEHRWFLRGIGLAMLLLAGSVANGQEKSAPAVPALEQLVPEGTMLIVSVPDVPGSVKEYRRTIMGQMAEYIYSKDFQTLLRHLGVGGRRGEIPDFRKAMAEQIKQATGMTFDEILELFDGECAVALVDVAMVDPLAGGHNGPPVTIDLVAKIGWKDATKGEEVIRTLVHAPAKGGDGCKTMFKDDVIGGFKSLVMESPFPSTPIFVFTPSCLVFGTQKKTVETLLSAFKAGKGIEKPLATNGEYGLAMKNIQQSQANVTFYLNWERVVNLPPLKAFFENQAPDLVDDLGFSHLTSVAFGLQIKDAQMKDRVFLRTTGTERKGLLGTLATPKTTAPEGILLSGEGDVSCLATLPFAAGIMAAIAVPTVMSVQSEAVSIGCMKNLMSLNQGAFVYAAKYGGPNKNFPDKTGKAFWETLSAPGIDVLGGSAAPYRCPHTAKTGICYRGPKKKYREIPSSGVVGCDDPDNHPDGSISVLLKDGSVQTAEKGSELYRQAMEETTE